MADDAEFSLSEALRRQVEKFARMIRRVGRDRGVRPDDIDQLLQDVRVKLWRSGVNRENLEQLSTSYMYRVAMSAAIDMLRKQRAGREHLQDDIESPANAHLSAPLVDVEGELELAVRMKSALNAMPRNRRIVVQLYLEGYDRTDIAGLTAWSEAKVRNLLYRGLDELRQSLSDTSGKFA